MLSVTLVITLVLGLAILAALCYLRHVQKEATRALQSVHGLASYIVTLHGMWRALNLGAESQMLPELRKAIELAGEEQFENCYRELKLATLSRRRGTKGSPQPNADLSPLPGKDDSEAARSLVSKVS